jgi:type I restriction enzyme S subunit
LLDFSNGFVGVPKIDKIIAELCPNGVDHKEISELGFLYGGMSGKTKENFNKGNSKYITYMNVYSNPATTLDVSDYVDILPKENQNKIAYGDVIFTGSSETPDECGMSSVVAEQVKEEIYLNSFCFAFRPTSGIYNPHFLKHLFRSLEIRKQIGTTANGVTRYNVSKELFVKVKIPIPPIKIQNEIVKILDYFSELVNSISEGLPAEIKARKQQYEYYRNKLFTFEEKQ